MWKESKECDTSYPSIKRQQETCQIYTDIFESIELEENLFIWNEWS